MNTRAHVIFTGKVQGVFFRANTQKFACAVEVSGWVRNLPDGSVEAVFEGEKGAVERAIQMSKERQPYATVDVAEIEWKEYTGEFAGFNIRY